MSPSPSPPPLDIKPVQPTVEYVEGGEPVLLSVCINNAEFIQK